MFQQLLKDELRRRDLSFRAAAREMNISASTLIAASEGSRALDIQTALSIAKWLGVPLGTLIVDMDPNSEKRNSVVGAINVVLRAAPKLEQVFQNAAKELENGTLTLDDFQEIVEFAAFTIQRRREQAREHEHRRIQEVDRVPRP